MRTVPSSVADILASATRRGLPHPVEHPLGVEVADDAVVAIHGDGPEAGIMRDYLIGFRGGRDQDRAAGRRPVPARAGRRLQPEFVAFNRNKHSVVLDLTTESGRASLLDLVAGADVLEDAQVAALGTIYRTHHPTEGELTGIHCPVLVDGTRPTARVVAAPTLGEHTAAVLAEQNRRRSQEP